MNTPEAAVLVFISGGFRVNVQIHVEGTPKMNSSAARIGYARVSTADQNLDAQIAALKAARCAMVRTETRRSRRGDSP